MSIRVTTFCDMCKRPIEDGDICATRISDEKWVEVEADNENDDATHICMICASNVYHCYRQVMAFDEKESP